VSDAVALNRHDASELDAPWKAVKAAELVAAANVVVAFIRAKDAAVTLVPAV